MNPDHIKLLKSADDLINLLGNREHSKEDNERKSPSPNNRPDPGFPDLTGSLQHLDRLENLDPITVESYNEDEVDYEGFEKTPDPPLPVGEKSIALDFSPREYDFRAHLISYLEKHYWMNDGVYPRISELEKEFAANLKAPSNREAWLDDLDAVAGALEARGLPLYRTDASKTDFDFILAVNLLSDFGDKRTKAAKLKSIGMTTRRFNALQARKANSEYYKSRMDRIFTEDLEQDAQASIARGIQNGDATMTRFYYEVTDKYRPQQSIGMDLSIILTTVMEILAKHVEGRVLAAIASELGQAPKIQKMIGVIDVGNS